MRPPSRHALVPLVLLLLVHPSHAADVDEAKQLIFDGINDYRQKQDLPKLASDPSLTQAAEAFAQFMARTGKYGHTADGRRPAERAEAAGYDHCIVLENIAQQWSSEDFQTPDLARRFVQGWIDSPGHHKNIVDPDVAQTGVGVARAADGRYYAVQLFGRPKSDAITFSVHNPADAPASYRLGDREFPLPPRVTRTHTICRPTTLTFAGGQSVRPASGETYTPGGAANHTAEP